MPKPGRCNDNRKARRAKAQELKVKEAELEKEKKKVEADKALAQKQLLLANQALTTYSEQISVAKETERKAKAHADDAHWKMVDLKRTAEDAQILAQIAHDKYKDAAKEALLRKELAETERQAKEKWKEQLRKQQQAGCASSVERKQWQACSGFLGAFQESELWMEAFFASGTKDDPAATGASSSSSKKRRQTLHVGQCVFLHPMQAAAARQDPEKAVSTSRLMCAVLVSTSLC